MAPDVHPTPSSQEAAPPRWSVVLCYDGSAEATHAFDRVGEIASAVPSQVAVVSVAEPIYKEPRYAGLADPGGRVGNETNAAGHASARTTAMLK